MSATLTVQLDADLLRSAEAQARAHQTTVNEVIIQQLRVMAKNWEMSRLGRTPVTDSLRGALKAQAGSDEKGTLTEAKYE